MTTNTASPPSSTPSTVLSGAGTFASSVSPPLNTKVTIAASGSVAIPETAEGYISANVIDSISGAGICGVRIIITDEDRARTDEIHTAVAHIESMLALEIKQWNRSWLFSVWRLFHGKNQ